MNLHENNIAKIANSMDDDPDEFGDTTQETMYFVAPDHNVDEVVEKIINMLHNNGENHEISVKKPKLPLNLDGWNVDIENSSIIKIYRSYHTDDGYIKYTDLYKYLFKIVDFGSVSRVNS